MTDSPSSSVQLVRFEEVTPTNEVVAYFRVELTALVASRKLPIFPAYDDLDELQFVFVRLPSGNVVVLGQYEHAPEVGVDLYVEIDRSSSSTAIAPNVPALIVETLQFLAIPRASVAWFHPDYEMDINLLLGEAQITEVIPPVLIDLRPSKEFKEPIDYFQYALVIYTRKSSPEHWALLQHNLGLAYYNRSAGERWRNLQESIECFERSLEVFDQSKHPHQWQINQEDLRRSQEILLETTSLWGIGASVVGVFDT